MTSPGGNDVEIRVIVRDLASTTLRGVAATARGLGTAASASLGPITGVGKALGAIGAAGGAINVVGGLGAALTAAAPAALVLPGALLAAAAAGATAKLAFSGMSDAIAAEDAAAFAEATKDMAPAAVEAASAIRDLKPAMQEVRQSVQQAFFNGLGPEIRRLGGEYMPLLKEGLTGISGELNLVGRGLVETFSSRDVQSDFADLLDETRQSLVGIGPAAGDAAAGVLKLGLFGTQQMNGLGEAVSGVASRFRTWVSEGVESGSFQEAFDRAKIVLQQFGEVAANVGAVVSSIFRGLAGGEDFSVFLDGLVELTGALREFFASVQAQTALAALGEALRAVSAAMGDLLLTALQAVAPVITALAPVVVALAEAFRTAFVDSGLLATVGSLLTQLVTAVVDSGLLDAFVELAGTVGGALATALIALAPVLIEIATAFGDFLTAAIEQLVDSGLLDRLIDLALRLVTTLWPLVPPLLELATACLPLFVMAIEAVLPVLEFLMSTIEAVRPVVEGLIGIMTFAAGALAGNFAQIQSSAENWGAVIRRKIDEVSGFFRDLPGRISGFLSGLPSMLANAGQRMLDSFASGIRRGFDAARNAVQNGLSALRRFFPFSPAKDGPFSGSGYTDESGRALVGDFAAAISAGQGKVADAARSVMSAAAAPLAGASRSGVSAAAAEILAHRGRGGGMFEDFSFRGNSDTVRRYNDDLVGMYRGGDVDEFLRGVAGAGASSSGGGGVVRFELVAGPGADSALASLIMRMVRTGELQLQVAG